MEHTLELAFETLDNTRRVLRITPCRTNLTRAQVESAATAIIGSAVLAWEPRTLIGAQVVAKSITKLV